MATYLILDLCVCAALVILFSVAPQSLRRKRGWAVLIMMLLMTAVFDNLIVAAGIVAYDAAKILGIYLVKAPVEDFFYAIVAAVLVPYLWERFGRK